MDNIDPATRSAVMARIRSKNTMPKMAVRCALFWTSSEQIYLCHILSNQLKHSMAAAAFDKGHDAGRGLPGVIRPHAQL